MNINRKMPNQERFFPWPGEEPGSKNGVVLRKLTHKFAQSLAGRSKQDQICLTQDFVIVSWTGLYDEDGEEIPCTAKNKRELMDSCYDLAVYITRCMQSMTAAATIPIVGTDVPFGTS